MAAWKLSGCGFAAGWGCWRSLAGSFVPPEDIRRLRTRYRRRLTQARTAEKQRVENRLPG